MPWANHPRQLDERKRQNEATHYLGQQSQWPIFNSLIQYRPLASWPQTNPSFELELVDSQSIEHIGPWSVQTSPTIHAVDNLSLFLSDGQRSFFYSGDGKLTPEGEELAVKADAVFLECEYLLSHESHGAWQDINVLPFTAKSHCFLYHIDPQCRSELNQLCQFQPNISVAYDGLTLSLRSDSLHSLKVTPYVA